MPQSPLTGAGTRFWLSARTQFTSDRDLIRVAWTVNGVELSALGTVHDTRVVFDLGPDVPARIEDAALEAAWSQADYGAACVPPGWTFEGFESRVEIERQVDARCQVCGTVGDSHEDLSDRGECPRCWIAGMATVEPVPPAAGTPEWLQTLRLAGAL